MNIFIASTKHIEGNLNFFLSMLNTNYIICTPIRIESKINLRLEIFNLIIEVSG